MSVHELEDADAAALAQALKENSALTEMDLSIHEFDEVDTPAIAQAYIGSLALTKLVLTCLSKNLRSYTLLQWLKQ